MRSAGREQKNRELEAMHRQRERNARTPETIPEENHSFRILVQEVEGDHAWWEGFDLLLGEEPVREGQPVFDGDIEEYGRQMVAWFNRTARPHEVKREFVRAETL